MLFFSIFITSNDKNSPTSNILNLKNFSIELQQNLTFETLLQQDTRIFLFFLFFSSFPLSRVSCLSSLSLSFFPSQFLLLRLKLSSLFPFLLLRLKLRRQTPQVHLRAPKILDETKMRTTSFQDQNGTYNLGFGFGIGCTVMTST